MSRETVRELTRYVMSNPIDDVRRLAHSYARGLIAEAYRRDGGTDTFTIVHRNGKTYGDRATEALRAMAQNPSISIVARAVYAGVVAERDARSRYCQCTDGNGAVPELAFDGGVWCMTCERPYSPADTEAFTARYTWNGAR